MKHIFTKISFIAFGLFALVAGGQSAHAQWKDPVCDYNNNCNGLVRVIRNSGNGTYFDTSGQRSTTLQAGDSNVGAAIYFWNTTTGTSSGTTARFQLRLVSATQYQISGTISGSIGVASEVATVNVPSGTVLRFNQGSGCIIRNNGRQQEPCRSTTVSGSTEDLTISIGTVAPDTDRKYQDQGQVSLVYEVVQAQQACPSGTTGTYPNCTPIVTQCPSGYTGTPPNCTLIIVNQQCPAGTYGTYPNCIPIVAQQCPAGTTGTYPNCMPVVVTRSECTDMVDNDRDGLIDIQDPGCFDSQGNYDPIYGREYLRNPGTPPPVAPPQVGCPTGSVLRGNVCTPEGTNLGGSGIRMSIATLLPTAVTQTEAELPGQLVNRSGEKATCWIEYGTSTRLGAMTQIQDCGNQSVIQFRNTIVGLRPNTRYYYRAVGSNSYGIIRGIVRSFRTNGAARVVEDQSDELTTVVRTTRPASRPVVIVQNAAPSPRVVVTNPAPVAVPQAQVQSQFVNGGSSLATVSIESDGQDFCPDSSQQLAVRVKNISNQALVNGLVQIQLPDGVEFRRATRGSYSSASNTVAVTVPSLAPQEEIITYIQVDITADVTKSDDVVTNVNYTYTNPATGAQEDAPNYLMGDSSRCKDGSGSVNGGALALFGGSFFPSTLLGWLILIFIVLALVLIARRVLSSYKKNY